jgi:methylated-DNA-protein-cysteine methyltransferase related protein
MYALPAGSRVPWQRVVNAQGKVSRRRIPGAELTQRALLEREGVRFGPGGRIPREYFCKARSPRSSYV